MDIGAGYVFWIHHEEVEGRFDWSGRRSLRAFVERCQEVGLFAVVRCGPWCHGEARNGGLPDWILRRDMRVRSDDPRYLDSVRRGADLDFRGTVVAGGLVEKVLAALVSEDRVVPGTVLFERAEITGTVRLDDIVFGGRVVFDHAQFAGRARFIGTEFRSEARFHDTAFLGTAAMFQASSWPR